MDETLEKERRNHVGRMIHMISHQLKRQNREPEMKTETGLTPMQKHVLTFILFETLDRELYQKDIEDEFHIRRSTASGILKLMEKNGFICRENVERDARLKRIVPTKKAEKLRLEILGNIQQMERRLRTGISEEDFSTCLGVLRKILNNLSEDRQTEKKTGGRHEQKTF